MPNSNLLLPPTLISDIIEDNKSKLLPPVCNYLVHNDSLQFMIVGGPNVRTDYHINSTEEIFYQVQGDMVLRIIDGGQFKAVPIHEGEMFALPKYTPHSPQRTANSVGIVIERLRTKQDALRWYCKSANRENIVDNNGITIKNDEKNSLNPGCGQILYETKFHCVDLGSQLKVVINDYYSDESKRICECGRVDFKPVQSLVVPETLQVEGEVKKSNVATELDDIDTSGLGQELVKIGALPAHKFITDFIGSSTWGEHLTVKTWGHNSPVSGTTVKMSMFFAINGDSDITINKSTDESVYSLKQGSVMIVDGGSEYLVESSDGVTGMVLTVLE